MPKIGHSPAAGWAWAPMALALFLARPGACAQSRTPAPAPIQDASPAPALSGQPVVLDRVAAVVNDDVILESDVEEEMRFTDLEGGALELNEGERQSALDRLIDRTLILQQIKATHAETAKPTLEEVRKQVDGLRRQIPLCAEQHCQTDAGWRAFLAGRGLTEEEVDDHWRERMLILSFIQSRFGTGIRISQPEIEDYYRQHLVAEFSRRKLQPPPLATVSGRIQEILLQQRVNTFLQEWLQGLKQEGNVTILNDDASGGAAAPAASGGRP